MKDTHFPLRNSKMAFVVLVALMFVAGGVFLITVDYQKKLNLVVGTAAILFFGAVAGVMIAKWRQGGGIRFTEDGVWEESSLSSVGYISWNDISHVEVIPSWIVKSLKVHVHDAEEFIAKASPQKRYWLKRNYKKTGAPILVSSSLLECSHHELLQKFQEHLGSSSTSNLAYS